MHASRLGLVVPRPSASIPPAFALSLVLLAPVAVAQTTWIVDQNNGPGTHFTDIPPAIAAAADGDTLLIRAGGYSPFSTGKALRVLGQGLVQINSGSQPAMQVVGLPPGKTFVAANLITFGAPFPFFSGVIDLVDSPGEIHLQGVTATSSNWPYAGGLACSISGCRSVTVTGGYLGGAPALSGRDSTLSLAGTTVQGQDSWASLRSWYGSSTGMSLTDCTTYLSRTTVHGGVGSSWPLPLAGSPAGYLTGGTLTITGDSATQISAGWSPQPISVLWTTGGTVHVDNNVALVGASGQPAIGGTATVFVRRIPSLTGQGAPLGGNLSAELVSPAGDFFWLVAGVPAAPLATPFGELFLNPAPIVLLAAGNQLPGEHFGWSATVPMVAALAGAPVGLQAASASSVGQVVEYSNPVVLIVH